MKEAERGGGLHPSGPTASRGHELAWRLETAATAHRMVGAGRGGEAPPSLHGAAMKLRRGGGWAHDANRRYVSLLPTVLRAVARN